jgi:hypothetical protein
VSQRADHEDTQKRRSTREPRISSSTVRRCQFPNRPSSSVLSYVGTARFEKPREFGALLLTNHSLAFTIIEK